MNNLLEQLDSSLFEVLDKHLSEKKSTEALQVIEDKKYSSCLQNICSDAVAIVVKYLMDENYRSQPNVYDACENLLKKIAEKSKEEEVLFELLEIVETTKSDNLFMSTLKSLQICLLRQKRNKARSLEWCLDYAVAISSLWYSRLAKRGASHSQINSEELCRYVELKPPLQIFNSKQQIPHDKQPKQRVPQDELRTSPAVASKFNVFTDKNATVILDIDEERQRISENIDETDDPLANAYEGLNLERGVNGVFEINDLVEVLRRDNAENIFVCTVPKELKYVDYICIATGRSDRHRKALVQFVRKLFKLKRHNGDILPKIEGEDSKEWIAMDLGNIALHIFSEDARLQYDLESLWTVGPQYDKECNKPDDDYIELLQNHTLFLKDLTPNARK